MVAALLTNCRVNQCAVLNLIFVYKLQVTPNTSFSDEELVRLTDRIQNAGTEVVNAKAGAVSRNILIQL